MRPTGCVEDIVNNNAIRRSCPTSALKSSYCSTDKPYFGVCRECSRHSQLIGCQQLKQNQKNKSNNGLYLSIIVGNNINLALGSSRERFEYKKDYEKFKLRVTSIILAVLAIAFVFPSRPIDAICNFLLVWYYCTLTIRESILRINGSKIKAWWVAHHYLACALAGVALTWPDDACYKEFRVQSIVFTAYIALVQQVQYQYQSGCLRRLTSLGEGDEMDVTLEGFASWMFRGLTFLLPMLFVVYFFEFYNAYTLYTLWTTSNCEVAWQVVALSAIFFIIACGNTVVVSLVVIRKLRESNDVHTLYEKLKSKYPSMQTIGKWRLLENSCVFEGAYNGGEGLINFNTSRKKASRRPGGSER